VRKYQCALNPRPARFRKDEGKPSGIKTGDSSPNQIRRPNGHMIRHGFIFNIGVLKIHFREKYPNSPCK
jgi:hypothetical protein